MKTDITKIKELLKKITTWPWKKSSNGWIYSHHYKSPTPVCNVPVKNVDRDFISQSPQLVSDLVGEVDRLLQELNAKAWDDRTEEIQAKLQAEQERRERIELAHCLCPNCGECRTETEINDHACYKCNYSIEHYKELQSQLQSEKERSSQLECYATNTIWIANPKLAEELGMKPPLYQTNSMKPPKD